MVMYYSYNSKMYTSMLRQFAYLLFTIIFFANCHAPKNTTSTLTKTEKEIVQKNTVTLLQTGIDFTAAGDNPTTWNVKINFEDSIYFSATDGNKFTVAVNKSKMVKNADGIVINSELKNAKIEINIYNEYCNTKDKTQKVTVTYLTKTYTGCGSYLKHPMLHNKWTLYKLRNKFVEDYVITPTLTIDMDKNKITGNDGCNNLKTTIKIEGDKIFFEKIIFTNNTCVTNEFTTILQNTVSGKIANYYFKNDMLYLYLEDDSLLAFKKSN
jgi:heat shock protein HslJ